MARRIRLRTVLLLVNLTVLALPLAGVQVLRIYESALVRQTESELIAQGEAIGSFYRATFERLTEFPGSGLPGLGDFLTEHSATLFLAEADTAGEPWQPRVAVLDLAESPIAGPLTEPVLVDGNADTLAMLVGETLTPVLKDLQRVTLAAIRVVDHRGVIVASTAADHGLSLAAGEEVRAALQGRGISRLREREPIGEPPALSSISRGGRIRVFVSTPIVYQDRVLGGVLLSRTPANIFQALYGKRMLLLQAAGLLLLVVVGIAYLTSRTIANPLRDLGTAARKIAAGDTAALGRVSPGGTEEIAALGESVHAMGDSLQRRANYLRDFTRHLSHEFKTPLAAIRGAVEVLQDHGQSMDADQRSGFLANIHADVDRLHNLTERLLDLARAETSSEAHETTVVASAVAQVEGGAAIAVAGQVDPPPLLAISTERLAAVLRQLAENARAHGGGHARIDVRRADGHAELVFSDDGPGISAGNRERVFEPFFTTARDAGGTGLGLSICRALLEGVGGRIELAAPPEGSGAAFRIVVPLAD